MVVNYRFLLLGFVLGFLPLACASIPFPYHYYNLKPASYDGTLLGPTAADDIPFSTCSPDALSQGKCVVLLAGPFFQLKADYLESKQSLIDCQTQLQQK